MSNLKKAQLMALTLATLTKTAKRYALNPSISDEMFLNALLEPYVIAGRVVGRGGRDFHLDKHRTSKILCGEAGVPAALRNVGLQHGLESRVAQECPVLFDETLNPALTSYMEEDVLALLDVEQDCRSKEMRVRLAARQGEPSEFMACALVGVMGFENKSTEEGIIWKKGSASLSWRVADLFRFGFGNRKKKRNLVVVPVDCGFKTHVTQSYETTGPAGVSEESVHGQWLSRMALSGVGEKELAQRLKAELNGAAFETDVVSPAFPIGTVAAIETQRAVYLLLAVSEFDEKGVARSAPEYVESAIRGLLTYYTEKGQGADLYLPLIGTGLSKTGLTNGEAYSIVCRMVIGEGLLACGKMTIVLRQDAARDIGLL